MAYIRAVSFVRLAARQCCCCPPRLGPLRWHSGATTSGDAVATPNRDAEMPRPRRSLDSVPSLPDFIRSQRAEKANAATPNAPALSDGNSRLVYIETFGCQMNESDSEVVLSVLAASGYTRTHELDEADVILTNTCAIRDNAEQKVWKRLDLFKSLKRRRGRAEAKPVVGVLGCMAERLKTKLLEADKGVDLVVGPDSYRDLPRLLDQLHGGAAEHAVNVALSLEETYADIAPVREDPRRLSAFVSIMRGCNNMCSFCVVPHTRGRERSRPAPTLEDEVRRLAGEGYREVTLLGQNVNSYHDAATPSDPATSLFARRGYETAPGFSNMFKLRGGDDGVRFTELLDRLTGLAPSMRFRFTSPHPKDVPDGLLELMAERPNLCKQLHMPAQSGSTRVLAAMRRGYTREAYLSLVARIRASVPGVALSSDFIAGFCGESDADHADTLSLIAQVGFEQAFMFAYSRRERTHAAYHYADDVPEGVKQERLQQVIAAFRAAATARNAAEVGRHHLVLVEGPARRSTAAAPQVSGRTDSGKRVVLSAAAAVPAAAAAVTGQMAAGSPQQVAMQSGDWVVCRVTAAGATSLHAVPVVRMEGDRALQEGAALVARMGAEAAYSRV